MRSILLAVLIRANGVCARAHLADILNISEIVVTNVVCRLRMELRKAKVLVRVVSKRGEGYYMPDEDKARLATLAVIQAKQDTP